jgi:hypothetical protein
MYPEGTARRTDKVPTRNAQIRRIIRPVAEADISGTITFKPKKMSKKEKTMTGIQA